MESFIADDLVSFSLIIDKDTSNVSPFDYISLAAEQTRADIIVSDTKYQNGVRWKIYFKTNNNENFIHINTSKGSALLDADESFTNTDLDEDGITEYRLKTTSLEKIIIYPFEQLKPRGYDVTDCIFYCESAKSTEVFKILSDSGFKIVSYGKGEFFNDSNPMVVLVPAAIFITCVAFYTFSEGKKIVLMKMEGCSSFDVVTQELLADLKCDLSVLLLSFSLTVVTVNFIVGYPIGKYFEETSHIFKMALYVIVFSIVVRLIITCLTNNHSHVKGAVPNNSLYVVINSVKAASISGLTIFCVYLIATSLIPVYNSYKSSSLYFEKLDNRTCFSSYGSYEKSILNDQNSKLLPFYMELCEEYDALYIDSSEYESIGELHIWELNDEQRPRVDINENYLDFSRIYDLNGNQITSDLLVADAFNVLLPDKITDEDRAEVDIYKKSFGFEKENVLVYDSKNFEMFSFINDGVDSDFGMITTPPTIYVFNYYVFETNPILTSQILYEKLFVKTSTNNPDLELRPIIHKYNLDNAIDGVSLINERINIYIREMQKFLVACFVSLLLIAVVMIGVSVFAADVYCRNNRYKLSIGLIEGKSLFGCIKNHLFLQIGIHVMNLILSLVCSLLLQLNLGIPILLVTITAGIDFAITHSRCLKQSYKNLYTIIKGEK